ncbi:hypothetical protein [Psychromonas sp. MME2]|uniref:hypothetical protein n=1 Tax=Psychromonas sp. MME2 TaxID=3231033 RepID=UPI00339C5BBA
MTDKTKNDDFSLFSAEFSGIKKLKQDTIKLPPKNNKKKQVIQKTIIASFESEHFSDGFEPHLAEENRSFISDKMLKNI